jgi:hypothetical protein
MMQIGCGNIWPNLVWHFPILICAKRDQSVTKSRSAKNANISSRAAIGLSRLVDQIRKRRNIS